MTGCDKKLVRRRGIRRGEDVIVSDTRQSLKKKSKLNA